jgi:hypothetical protein
MQITTQLLVVHTVCNLHVITTARRDVLYIHEMMDSLFASKFDGPITFLAGCADESYLDRYRTLPQVTIVSWNIEHHQSVRKHMCARIDCKHNQERAILWNNNGPMLLCEDDVVFDLDWQQKLESNINFITDKDYILDIAKGSIYCKNQPPVLKGSNLQGAQGVYFSSQLVRNKIAVDLAARSDGCSDVIIGKIALENFKFWTSQEHIVRHIGNVSTFDVML